MMIVEVVAIAWGINILSGVINTIGTRAVGMVSKVNCELSSDTTFFKVGISDVSIAYDENSVVDS